MPRPLLALALAAALVAPVRAQEPAPADPNAPTAAPTGVLTKMPVLAKFVEAPYPSDAEKARTQGSVLIEIDIGADGLITRAEVIEKAGHGFDEAALAAVKQFRFEPAEIDHAPAPVRLTYRYEFILRPEAPPPPSSAAPTKPGVVTFEGLALERGTRQPLAGAVVAVSREGAQALDVAVDSAGRFAFEDLAPGAWKVTILAPNFEKFETTEEIRAGEVTSATYRLRRRTSEFETTVRAKREAKEVARRTITLEEIRKIPGTQGDAIRVVQNLPGVARTPLGLGPLVVRGGRPGDTRTYIDGQLVPLLFHFGGLTSVINSDFLDTLDFYPGNFPVRYGRSIAGAVDVNTRAGKKERVHGYANVNLTESTLFLEGPLGEKGSFMASARRSYIDVVLPVILDFLDFDALAFNVVRFWDYQLKADFAVGRNELSFFLFGSDDRLGVLATEANQVAGEGRDDFQTQLGFHRLTARWGRKLAEKWANRVSVTLGTDRTSTNVGGDLYGHVQLDTVALREELTFRHSDALTLQGGLDVIGVRFGYELQAPPAPGPGQFADVLINDQLIAVNDAGFSVQPALFIDAVSRPLDGLKLVPGLRADYDSYIRRWWLDPRLTSFYEVDDCLLFKASAGIYHQPPTPEKLLPRFGNPDLTEEGSRQYAAGVEYRFTDLFDVDFQLYWKDLYGEATRPQQLTTSAAQVAAAGRALSNSGTGRAYGLELLVRRQPGLGRVFGWLAVSLAQTDRRAAPGEPLVQSFLNQRFNIVGVATWKSPWWGLELGSRVRIADGNPATAQVGSIYDSDPDLYLPIPSPDRRTVRRPTFFQLDVRLDRRFVYEKWILDAYVEVQNATYHRNVEGETPNYDYTEWKPTYGLPIFPFFGVRAEY